MPNIRFRNPDNLDDELAFVDVDENDLERIARWERWGWVREDAPPQEVEAARRAADRARQVFERVFPPEDQVAPPPVPRDWPDNEVWENFGVGARFHWGGDEFEVFAGRHGERDIQRFIPNQPFPRLADGLVPAAVKSKTGEDLFRLILSGIQEVYGVDAVIAGGAVRDLVVGDTAGTKDVDVFIPMKWEEFNKQSDELGWQGKPGLLRVKPYKGKGTGTFTSSARAAAVVQGRSVDLVFVDGGLTPERVDAFPVNAQKCVWNLQEGLVVSPAARADIDGKKFTISPAITDKQVIANLSLKISGWMKRPCYKGWKLITPETKDWWQKQNDPYTVERGTKKMEKKTKKYSWEGWWPNADEIDPWVRVVE